MSNISNIIKFHNTITDCDGTTYVLGTHYNSSVVHLFRYQDSVENIQLCMAVLFIDKHNGDVNNPKPMIEWTESVQIRPEIVIWFIENGIEILKQSQN